MQMRTPGADRWYSPDRDLAYCWQSLMQSAADGLEETRWQDWFGDYFKYAGLTEKEIGDAMVAYATAVSRFADPDVTLRQALEESGWFALPKAAQAAICLKLGQVATCAFYNAIRDVTIEGEKPQLNQEAFMKSALKAQEVLGAKGPSLFKRLRSIIGL